LSRFSEDKDYFQMIVEKSLKLLILSAFFIITLSIVSSKFIIVSLYSSSYANSSDIFQILVITLVSTYPNYILGSSLFSLNRQKSVLRVVFSALILNLILNILLIPTIGGKGAAIAAVISGISIMFGYIWLLRDKINSLNLMSMLFRTFMISFLLVALSLFAKDIYSLFIILPVIAISYVLLSYIFKIIKRNEIKRVRDLFTNIINKA